MNTLIGQQLGNYRLVRMLGQGGFAYVYLGEHVRLDMKVAIKVLKRGLDEGFVQQFLNEAQTLVDLEHPHIVRVRDFGITEDQRPYLVMDYAPHGSLRDRHAKGTQLSLDTVVSYVKQVANALQYAHDRKKIHRDVKPENMLLSAGGQVLLSDFGLVDVAQTTMSGAPSIKNATSKKMAGTPQYMPPEQFRGRSRPASDQYALAIVVYEWLSGTPPFSGTTYALSYQHSHKFPPSLHEKNRDISLTVEEVVMRALAKEPRQRYASVELFAEALEKASQEEIALSHIMHNRNLTTLPVQSLIPTLVKEPLQSSQHSQTVEKQFSQPTYTTQKAQSAHEIFQGGDESHAASQLLHSASIIAPPEQTSQNAIHTTNASTFQEIDELKQAAVDDWMNLRWFILTSAILTFLLFAIGFLFQLPTITALSLIPGVINLILGLLETGHFNQWYWFVGVLLLSPLTGILYAIVNPERKPQRPINMKQLIIVLSCLGYALVPVSIFISSLPTISNGPRWLIWYFCLGLILSGWLLGLIRTAQSRGLGDWIILFFFPLTAPFAGIIAAFDSDTQQQETSQNQQVD